MAAPASPGCGAQVCGLGGGRLHAFLRRWAPGLTPAAPAHTRALALGQESHPRLPRSEAPGSQLVPHKSSRGAGPPPHIPGPGSSPGSSAPLTWPRAHADGDSPGPLPPRGTRRELWLQPGPALAVTGTWEVCRRREMSRVPLLPPGEPHATLASCSGDDFRAFRARLFQKGKCASPAELSRRARTGRDPARPRAPRGPTAHAVHRPAHRQGPFTPRMARPRWAEVTPFSRRWGRRRHCGV